MNNFAKLTADADPRRKKSNEENKIEDLIDRYRWMPVRCPV